MYTQALLNQTGFLNRPAPTTVYKGPDLKPMLLFTTRTGKLTVAEMFVSLFQAFPNTYAGRKRALIERELKQVYSVVNRTNERLMIIGCKPVVSLSYDVAQGPAQRLTRVYIVIDHLGIITQWTQRKGHVKTYRKGDVIYMHNSDRIGYLAESGSDDMY